MTEQGNQLEELINQLLALGYYKHQIDHIIRDIVEEEDISQLSETQEQLLVETLRDYIQFAVKCRKKL